MFSIPHCRLTPRLQGLQGASANIRIKLILPETTVLCYILAGSSKWNTNFQLKRSKVKVAGRQKPPQSGLFAYGRSLKRRRVRCRLQTRPTPLLGLICFQCVRRSASGRTAACPHSVATCFLVVVNKIVPISENINAMQ